jgi:hypothetical protein
MSWWELSALAQAVRAAALYGWFLWRQSGHAASGALSGEAGIVLLGWEMLLLILVTVGAGIVLQIGATILTTFGGEEDMMALDDERDRLFEARATVRGFAFCGLGFLLAVLALWQGWGAYWGFNIILAGMVAADVIVNLDRFRRYWRGD